MMTRTVPLDGFLGALRSDKYEQTRSVLHRKNDGYCCLGVWVQEAAGDKDGLWDGEDNGLYGQHCQFVESSTSIESELGKEMFAETMGIDAARRHWENVTEDLIQHLVRMNDNGKTFKQIAYWIQRSSRNWIRERFQMYQEEV